MFVRFVKSYTARKLIDHLKECRTERLLQQLAFSRKEYKREDRDYQCWEERSHPQFIENEQVLRQKLEYIHQNPVKRGYVDEPTSSARDYAGVAGVDSCFHGLAVIRGAARLKLHSHAARGNEKEINKAAILVNVSLLTTTSLKLLHQDGINLIIRQHIYCSLAPCFLRDTISHEIRTAKYSNLQSLACQTERQNG